MYLENPVFRKLVRAVIASIFDEGKRAWNEVIKKFGLDLNKAMEAGVFIWENRGVKPFSILGDEEISSKAIDNIFTKLVHANKPVTMGNILIASREQDFEKGTSNVPPKLPDILIKKLIEKHERDDLSSRAKQIYNDINSAYKAKSYLQIVGDKNTQQKLGLIPGGPGYSKVPLKDVLDKRTEGYEGPEIPEYKNLPKKYANLFQPSRQRQLNVILRYIDSFES